MTMPAFFQFKLRTRSLNPLVNVRVPNELSTYGKWLNLRYVHHLPELKALDGLSLTITDLVQRIDDIFCLPEDSLTDMQSAALWNIIDPEQRAHIAQLYDQPLVSNEVLHSTINMQRVKHDPTECSDAVKERIHWVLRELLLREHYAIEKIDLFTVEQLLSGVKDADDTDDDDAEDAEDTEDDWAEITRYCNDSWRIYEWAGPSGTIMYVGGYPGDNAHGYGVWFGQNGTTEPLWSDHDGHLAPCCPAYTVHEKFVDTDRYGSASEDEAEDEAEDEGEAEDE